MAAVVAVVALWFGLNLDHRDRPAWALPLSGVVIAVDAGHGGPDGGAVSADGVMEKDVVLPVALYLRDFLQEAGALVVMTRETDADLAAPETKGLSRRKTEDLLARARLVNEKGADLLISVHANSIPSPRWFGAQTFYHPGREASGRVAALVQEELRAVLANTDRQPKRRSDLYPHPRRPVPGRAGGDRVSVPSAGGASVGRRGIPAGLGPRHLSRRAAVLCGGGAGCRRKGRRFPVV